MSAGNLRNELGPYKATKLWNDIVRVFRTGMPIGKRWKQFRSYDDCFIASDAVEWLLEYLQQHHEAGTEISRSQVMKLLHKFHTLHYIEDVRGLKYDDEPFAENGRLFRFVALSPMKTPQWNRQPLSVSHDNLAPVKSANIFVDEPLGTSSDLKASEPETRRGTRRNGPVKCLKHTEHLWKTKVLSSLSSVLEDPDLSRFVSTSSLNPLYSKHNLTMVHRNGYVTGVDKNLLPPPWVVSAMRFLARWPDQDNDTFPKYQGFEKDVFTMIKDYFDEQKEPVLTFLLSPVLIAVYDHIEGAHPSPIVDGKTRVFHVSETTPQRPKPRPQTRPTPWSPSAIYRRAASGTDSDYQSQSADSAKAYAPRITKDFKRETQSNMMVVYDSPANLEQFCAPKPAGGRCYYYEKSDEPSYNSYRQAVDKKMGDQNLTDRNKAEKRIGVSYADNGNNDNETTRLPRTNSTTMQRAASLSHLLAGPRIETAFVGDDAYTVYYGAARNRLPTEPARGRSCFHLNRAPSVGELNSQPFRQLDRPLNPRIKPHREILSRPLSAYFAPPPAADKPNHPSRDSHRQPRPMSTHGVARLASPEYSTDSSAQYFSCNSGGSAWEPNAGCKPSGSCSHIPQADGDHPPIVHYVEPRSSLVQENLISELSLPPPAMIAPAGVYQDTGSIRRQVHSTPSVGNEPVSPPASLFEGERDSRLISAYQKLLLFLPPANRRVLHMLLKLLSKLSNNHELQLSEHNSNKQQVIVSLWRAIVRTERQSNLDEKLAVCVAEFLVRHYEEILTVPSDLKTQIEFEIHQIHAAQHKRSQQTVRQREPKDTKRQFDCQQDPVKMRSASVGNRSIPNTQPQVAPSSTAFRSRTNLALIDDPIPPKAISRLGISPKSQATAKAFCQQISKEQYESQAQSLQKDAMTELLNNIIEDTRMSNKEKCRKLKQFERTYPEVYSMRFRNSEKLQQIVSSGNKKNKKSQLLSNPINVLKRMR